MAKAQVFDNIKITGDTLVNSQYLGKVLGVSPQRVRQLVADGIIKREENNRYKLVENVQQYFQYKTKDHGTDYDKEHARLEKAKRELAEIDLAEKKKVMHKTEDIEMMVGGMVIIFKRTMLAIPHKVAKQCEGKSTEEINDILAKEINGALVELSNFDASKLGEIDDTEEDD